MNTEKHFFRPVIFLCGWHLKRGPSGGVELCKQEVGAPRAVGLSVTLRIPPGLTVTNSSEADALGRLRGNLYFAVHADVTTEKPMPNT